MPKFTDEILLDGQRATMERINVRSGTMERAPEYRVHTFGCQQNEADSEQLRGMLEAMGYKRGENDDSADVIVINTCAIREHAEAKVLGVIGSLKRIKTERPELIIAVCGCMAQRPEISAKLRESYKFVDLVFGTHALWRFPELLETAVTGAGRVFDVADSDGEIAEGLPVSRDRGVNAWLTVMYGCNNFCTYCIVPYVRGRERSRTPEAILDNARRLIAEGALDITLLGQNVNSYGRDRSQDRGRDRDSGSDSEHNVYFPELLRKIGELDGDFLIRFMTSHPKDATEELFRAMAETPKVARHIHLPFQCGSNRVLKLMNRGYTRERYLELIATARHYMPDIVITSDVIVGFPGETEAEFEETYSLIEQVRFDSLFTFIHSPRPGAPSAELDDPVPRSEKQVWFDRMTALQGKISAERHSEYVGKTLRVLINAETGDAIYPFAARTNGNRLVRLSEGVLGEYKNVKITDCNTWSLIGETI